LELLCRRGWGGSSASDTTTTAYAYHTGCNGSGSGSGSLRLHWHWSSSEQGGIVSASAVVVTTQPQHNAIAFYSLTTIQRLPIFSSSPRTSTTTNDAGFDPTSLRQHLRSIILATLSPSNRPVARASVVLRSWWGISRECQQRACG
jgi:hypothetical protein